MVSKEYLHTARTLLRIAKNMTDQTIANRLMTLASDYESRAQRADLAETAKAIAPAVGRAEAASRTAKST
jgi:hypothetical protein